MTILSTVAARKEYRKYIQLFVEIILVITLLNPLLGLFGKSSDLFEKISFDSFWQNLEGLQMDREKMDFLNEDYYIAYYENAIEEDHTQFSRAVSGYGVMDVTVSLNDAFQVETMELKVAKRDVETVVVGTIEEQPESKEIAELKKKIAAYYQMDTDRISILD
jgi:hypothetical protein